MPAFDPSPLFRFSAMDIKSDPEPRAKSRAERPPPVPPPESPIFNIPVSHRPRVSRACPACATMQLLNQNPLTAVGLGSVHALDNHSHYHWFDESYDGKYYYVVTAGRAVGIFMSW